MTMVWAGLIKFELKVAYNRNRLYTDYKTIMYLKKEGRIVQVMILSVIITFVISDSVTITRNN